MRERRVVYLPLAREDLRRIGQWITHRVSKRFAKGYLARIRDRIETLCNGSERGTLRDDVRQGTRVIGIMKSITIAFTVTERDVIVLRVFYGGQDRRRELSDENDDDD